MRTQWCREHIDEVGENCGLSTSAITEVKQVAEFCTAHLAFANLPTRSIRPLLRERNEEIKARAISSISKSLESGKHPITGKHLKKGRLTEVDVKKVIEQKDRELRLEAMAEARDNHIEEIATPETPPEENENKQSATVQKELSEEPILERRRITNTDKIQYLTDNILKPEHIKTLQAVIDSGEATDLLDALYLLLDAARID
jgi:hypothetical protein